MIFKYGSEEFKILRNEFKAYFDKYINADHGIFTDTLQKSLSGIYHILTDSNIEELTALDNENLTFHKWNDTDEIIKDEDLGYENKILLEIYNRNHENTPEIEILLSMYIALYADIYEATFVIKDAHIVSILKGFLNILNSKYKYLPQEGFDRITRLWFRIPNYLFAKHLDKNLHILKKLEDNVNFVEEKFAESGRLKSEIDIIQKTLDEQKSEYNFVGLSNGFTNLKEQKVKELKTQNWAYYSLMVIIVIALIVKFYWSINYLKNDNFNSLAFIVTTASTILIILIILYFFRISLMNIKSIKSQILQIDLRLTLCQFIHSYDAGTESLRKEHMKESLNKFESIIFAPIVATEEQIPTTFDGLEQLTAMVGLFNKKPD